MELDLAGKKAAVSGYGKKDGKKGGKLGNRTSALQEGEEDDAEGSESEEERKNNVMRPSHKVLGGCDCTTLSRFSGLCISSWAAVVVLPYQGS